jgi:two-component system response regulator VicR
MACLLAVWAMVPSTISLPGPVKVLLVDDDHDFLALMSASLSQIGFLIRTCHNANNLWRDIEDFQPHIVLMDIQMNEVSGETCCRQMKASTKTVKIPLLMFSSHADIELIAVGCGADGFISKSRSLTDIKKMLLQSVATNAA